MTRPHTGDRILVVAGKYKGLRGEFRRYCGTVKAYVLLDGASKGEICIFRSSIQKDPNANTTPQQRDASPPPPAGDFVAVPRAAFNGLMTEIDNLSNALRSLRAHAAEAEETARHRDDVYRVKATFCPAMGRNACRCPNEDYFTNKRCIYCQRSVHVDCCATIGDTSGGNFLVCIDCTNAEE